MKNVILVVATVLMSVSAHAGEDWLICERSSAELTVDVVSYSGLSPDPEGKPAAYASFETANGHKGSIISSDGGEFLDLGRRGMDGSASVDGIDSRVAFELREALGSASAKCPVRLSLKEVNEGFPDVCSYELVKFENRCGDPQTYWHNYLRSYELRSRPAKMPPKANIFIVPISKSLAANGYHGPWELTHYLVYSKQKPNEIPHGSVDLTILGQSYHIADARSLMGRGVLLKLSQPFRYSRSLFATDLHVKFNDPNQKSSPFWSICDISGGDSYCEPSSLGPEASRLKATDAIFGIAREYNDQ